MAAGAIGPNIGRRIEQLDSHDRRLARRSAKVPLVLAVCAVVLTACAWDPPTIERTPRDAAGGESNAKSRLATRKGAPQNGVPANGVPGEKIDGPGPAMAALEVDLTNFKDRLIGLDSDEINDLMGTPGLERAEPPALIWQYRHQVCTVDIFMFDDGAGSTVDHVEVRPTSGGVNEKECFTALLRNVPPPSPSAARAPASQPIAPAPSTPVGRRPAPSAAPPPGPAQTPSSSRPPVPSTAAPSAAPVMPSAVSAAPDGEDGPPPADTDVDFDFGAPAATPVAPSGAASPRSSIGEAIPTLPPEFSDEIQSGAKQPAPAGPTGSLGIEIPPSADAATGDEFSDPLDSAPPPAVTRAPPPAPTPAASAITGAKPAVTAPREKPTATPAPVPLAAAPPAPPPAPPIVLPAAVPPPPVAAVPRAAPAPIPAPIPAPSAAPIAPAPLVPAPRASTATAAAQPKGATKSAARPIQEIDDEDLPPDVFGRRDDDPSRNNEDMVE